MLDFGAQALALGGLLSAVASVAHLACVAIGAPARVIRYYDHERRLWIPVTQ
jgi:hypothetical protein